MKYIHRTVEKTLKKAAREFPAVVLTGPRQSGKTTVLKKVFHKFRYVSLEMPDVRLAAVNDPRGFMDSNGPPVIFDEIQYAPEILPYVKERIDSERGKKGRFVLTGSQNLSMAEKVSESLAGRAAVLKLLPLSLSESRGEPGAGFSWERGRGKKSSGRLDCWKSFLRGFFPEIVADGQRDFALYHSSYVQTYLERDVRNVRQVGDLTLFQTFLRAVAARSGGLFNLTEVARDVGLAVNTARNWLSVLEATFQVIVVRPYFENLGKRLVKTPKVYFTDTGTLCHLVGLKDPSHAASGPMAGALFETAVLSELFKRSFHRGLDPRIYFWRTSTGDEVDFLVEGEGKTIALEAKASSTPRPGMADGVKAFLKNLRRGKGVGYVVHCGEHEIPLGAGVKALPLTEL